MSNMLRRLAETETELEAQRVQRSTLRLAWIGAVTGIVGAIAGLIALVVTALRPG
jgi:hypothetical protein